MCFARVAELLMHSAGAVPRISVDKLFQLQSMRSEGGNFTRRMHFDEEDGRLGVPRSRRRRKVSPSRSYKKERNRLSLLYFQFQVLWNLSGKFVVISFIIKQLVSIVRGHGSSFNLPPAEFPKGSSLPKG